MRRWNYMLNKEFHLINCLNVIQCVQWPNVAAPTLTRRWHCAFVKMILHKLIWQVFVSYSTFILSTSFLKYIYVCMWLIEWIYWLFHISHNLNQVLLCDYSVLSICHWHIVSHDGQEIPTQWQISENSETWKSEIRFLWIYCQFILSVFWKPTKSLLINMYKIFLYYKGNTVQGQKLAYRRQEENTIGLLCDIGLVEMLWSCKALKSPPRKIMVESIFQFYCFDLCTVNL